MDFGFGVPTRGPMSAPQALATLAAGGEELGFSEIGVSDHIVVAAPHSPAGNPAQL